MKHKIMISKKKSACTENLQYAAINIIISEL